MSECGCGAIEEWRPVVDAPGYLISSCGRVLSLMGEAPRLMKLHNNRYGYWAVSLAVNKKQVHKTVHRMVGVAFLPAPSLDQWQVRHLDGDPRNAHAANLAWGTNSDNQLDAVRHGTNPWTARTHCGRGHEYTDENTYWRIKNGNRSRQCIACRNENARRARRQRKAA